MIHLRGSIFASAFETSQTLVAVDQWLTQFYLHLTASESSAKAKERLFVPSVVFGRIQFLLFYFTPSCCPFTSFSIRNNHITSNIPAMLLRVITRFTFFCFSFMGPSTGLFHYQLSTAFLTEH